MFGFRSAESYRSEHCLLKNVGVASFNQQHLRLASYAVEFSQIVGQLAEREPTPEDWRHIDALFSRISRFVATHFSEEEAMMESYGYPGYPGHKKQHDKFVQELTQIKSQINDRNLNFKGKLSTLLWDWLYKHINEVDYQYGEFFREKGIS